MVETSFSAPRSLYVHVPFCAQKCNYCAFYSTAASGDLVNRYVDAVVCELELRSDELGRPLRTVFFGGGTPSLLNLCQWTRLLRAFEKLDLLGAAEWTVECNPATVSPDKARLLRDFGVNRVSMGVQSLDETLLERLGRVHTRDMVFRSFDHLRAAGFTNLNLDVMFAIPGQTLAAWEATLVEVLSMQSEHLSCYEVIYEEDTPLFARLKAGEIDLDEDLAAAMFDRLLESAAASGLRQYEIANFAREAPPPTPADRSAGANTSIASHDPRRQPRTHPRAREGSLLDPMGGTARGEGLVMDRDTRDPIGGSDVPARACLHNVNYWRGGPYAALGPSASGYECGIRYRNSSNTPAYCESLERGDLPRDWQEELPPVARAGEIAAFGLRMNAGWSWESFFRATGLDLRDGWAGEMRSLEERGWALIEADRFRLTPAGLRFADAAGAEFLRPGTTERVVAG